MKIVDLSLDQLKPASWNANVMDEADISRLNKSLTEFGFVQNLVVRPIGDGTYEVIAGNQRLRVLRQQGVASVQCAAVDVDDARAKLLSQVLNRTHGEDDLGLRAELMRQVLGEWPSDRIIALLPETSESLQALMELGTADMAASLADWQKAQKARLRHMTFHLTGEQQEVVEDAMKKAVESGELQTSNNPNMRGNVLYQICKRYLEVSGV